MKNKIFLRWFRRALIAVALLLVYLAFSPRQVYTVPEQDASMDPIYPPGTDLLVERLSPDDPLEQDMDVVYAVELDGVEYARFGRVRGLAGDQVSVQEGLLAVNGVPTVLRGQQSKALGAVPGGHVLVLNINPLEERYGDSRSFGFIERSRIRHRIRARIARGEP